MFDTLFNPFVKLFGSVAFFPPDLHIPQEQFSDQFQAAGESAKGHIPHDSHDNSQHSQTTGTSVLHGKKEKRKAQWKENGDLDQGKNTLQPSRNKAWMAPKDINEV